MVSGQQSQAVSTRRTAPWPIARRIVRIIGFSIAAVACSSASAPPTSCERGAAGWVTLEFDISPAGAVVDPEVIASCPDDRFEAAALRSIRKWKYEPSPDGASDVQITLEFRE